MKPFEERIKEFIRFDKESKLQYWGKQFIINQDDVFDLWKETVDPEREIAYGITNAIPGSHIEYCTIKAKDATDGQLKMIFSRDVHQFIDEYKK